MKEDSINLTVSVPRGMIFLYDQSASNVEIPAYVKGETIAFSDTAISIATISDLDGETTILLTTSGDDISKNANELFSGKVLIETGKLDVCIMGDEAISQISAQKGLTNITVYGDGKPYPESVSILIENTN